MDKGKTSNISRLEHRADTRSILTEALRACARRGATVAIEGADLPEKCGEIILQMERIVCIGASSLRAPLRNGVFGDGLPDSQHPMSRKRVVGV